MHVHCGTYCAVWQYGVCVCSGSCIEAVGLVVSFYNVGPGDGLRASVLTCLVS